jgi:DNA-binding XRE family transcriptional regulator
VGIAVKETRGRKMLPITGNSLGSQIARKIRARREELGLSVDEAAARTGGYVNNFTWYTTEKDRYVPRLATMLAICVAMRIKLQYLLPVDASVMLQGVKMDPKDVVAALMEV